MRRQRRGAAFAATLLSTALIASAAAPVAAQDGAPDAPSVPAEALRQRLEAPAPAATSVPDLGSEVDEPLASTSTLEAAAIPAKPKNDVIRDVPVNPADASIPLNLIPYHEFAPRLRALQQSDRISVEIIGQSVQGRDLHLVVATTMEDDEWADWQRLSDLRTDDPEAAIEAFEAGEYDDWRAPIFINNNIHGNEWEGTDAFFEYVDELAFSDDPGVVQLLEDFLFVGTVTNNPDGRVNATRANAANFDMNRDWIAQTQPEVRIVRDQILRYDPVSLIDLHGYTGLTLIEPTTGPHGQNYEMDLYAPLALGAAESMEQAIIALGEARVTTPVNIPFRDRADDWDGWPGVYTPMWAMQHGAVGHTIEFPLNPRGIPDVRIADRHERTRINTAVARASMEGNTAYVASQGDRYLADQLEFFRRGVAGEPTRPITDPYAVESAACGSFTNDVGATVNHCNWNTYAQEFPRAWVIPTGDEQRSETAAVRVAQYLLDNGIAVHRATEDVTIGGETYEAGSFVVDMHQAKRGAANNALELGRNLSDDWAGMYGDAAWSVGALYGATLVDVTEGDLPATGLTEITDAATPGEVPADGEHLGFEVDSLYGIQTVHAFRRAGVAVSRLPDGTFVVPGTARRTAQTYAAVYGQSFEALSDVRVRDAVPVDTLTVGVSVNHEALTPLVRMGFDVVPVSNTLLANGTVSFEDLDALYIGTGGNAFRPDTFAGEVADDWAAWLADGNTIVAQNASGIQFVQRGGLTGDLTVGGIGGGDGIVSVVNDPDSPVVGDALDVSFVRSTRFFPNADEVAGVTVHQRFADGEGYFLAGHQRGYRAAAGQPALVSWETAGGTEVVLFGTDPTARAHTEGLFPQVAEALWPALPDRTPLAPTADAGDGYEIELGDELVLDGTASSSPDELDLTFSWDVTELGGTTLEGGVVTYTPQEAGTFEVELTVTDTNEPALSDTDTATVTVTEVDEPGEPGPGPDPGPDPGPGPGPGEPGAPCDTVSGPRFPDVDGGPHGANIGCVAGFGIALGSADGTYRPGAAVRRDQMTSFLARMLTVAGVDLPASPTDRFADDQGGTHELATNQLAALGVVQGRADGSFDPSGSVTRGQMASFLVRSLEVVLDRDLTAAGGPFTDTAGSPHTANIDVAASLGIALGRTSTAFEPNSDVRRDQMASFLARSLAVLVDEGVELTPIG